MLALPRNVKSVVLLWLGRIGDLLITTPVIAAIRRRFPGARITLVTGVRGVAAASLIGDVDEVRVLRPFYGAPANLPLAAGLALREADVLIDLNTAFSRSAWTLARLACARAKIGFCKGPGDRAFTDLLAAPDEKEHMLDRYGRLAKALDAPYDPCLRISIPPPDMDAAAAARRGLQAPPGRRLVAIFAGNFNKTENRWPEDRFAAWTERLLERDDVFPYFLAGPGEEEAVRAVVSRLSRPVPVAGPLPLGVAAALLKETHILAGNCTGTTHLAIAAGTPTFTFLSRYTQTVWMPRPSGAAPHYCVVSDEWESCRKIPVDKAYAAFTRALKNLKDRS